MHEPRAVRKPPAKHHSPTTTLRKVAVIERLLDVGERKDLPGNAEAAAVEVKVAVLSLAQHGPLASARMILPPRVTKLGYTMSSIVIRMDG